MLGHCSKIACFAFAVVVSSQAAAWGPTPAHVTLIDPSGMGSRYGDTHDTGGSQVTPIVFQIDQAISGNPCGSSSPTDPTTVTLLYYPGIAFTDSGTTDISHPAGNDRQMVSEKATLSMLQLALATGLKINVYGSTGSGGYCLVGPIQITNQY